MAKELKSLQQATTFNHLNVNGRVSNLVGQILDKADTVDMNSPGMEQAFVTMKLYKYPLRPAVIDAVSNNKIIMKFAPNDMKMSRALPFVLTRSTDGVNRAVIMLDHFATKDRDGNYNADAKKLYTILESAYLGLIYANNHQSLPSKSGIIKHGSLIYSEMFVRALSRKYALNSDRIKKHKVQFLASKFFIINVLGARDSETVTNYALANCAGGNNIILKEVDDIISEDAYTDLESLISALKNPDLNLNFGESLTTRSFIEQFIMMFDPTALLALEIFPYFTMTVNSVVNGAYINNQIILEDIVDKVGIKYYQEMINLSRS